MTQAFYDQLAPYFHFLYSDWEASVARRDDRCFQLLLVASMRRLVEEAPI
jgi:hypothetical protein